MEVPKLRQKAGNSCGDACGALTHPTGSIFLHWVRPTLNLTYCGWRAQYFYSLRVVTEYVYLMRPAPTVYFYFLRVTPTILLLRAGGTHRTELPSYSRHAAASTPLVGCAANLLSAVYAFLTTCNSWYLWSSKRNSIRMHSWTCINVIRMAWCMRVIHISDWWFEMTWFEWCIGWIHVYSDWIPCTSGVLPVYFRVLPASPTVRHV